MELISKIRLVAAADKMGRNDLALLILQSDFDRLEYKDLIQLLPGKDLFTAVDVWRSAATLVLE